MERSGVLPTTQFAYRISLGTCDALLCVLRTLQNALTIRELSVSLFCGFWGSVLSILTQLVSDRSQHVIVDGCRSKRLTLCQDGRREVFFGILLFLLYTSELFSVLENKMIGYANDSTLIAVVPSPGLRVAVAESLSRALVKVSEWW